MSPQDEPGPSPPGRVASLSDAAATERAGRALGAALETVLGPGDAAGAGAGAVLVGLAGGLGAGKTTLARACLRGLGVEGTVRSPTYTLAEPYRTRLGSLWHLDLYRIAGPDELEYIAVRDLVAESVACLVEWPERGAGALPELDCRLELAPAGRGRRLRVGWGTARGGAIGERLLVSMSRDPRPGGGPGT